MRRVAAVVATACVAACTPWSGSSDREPDAAEWDLTDADTGPDASPDAHIPGEFQFLFTRVDIAANSIHLALGSLDGRYYTLRVLNGGPHVTGQPVLSPDGMRVAFVSFVDGGGGWTLFVRSLDADNADEHVLARNGVYGNVEWSPDGASIAFVAATNTTWGVYVVPADGSASPRLLGDIGVGTPQGECFTPSWSPDGTELAFSKFNEVVSVNVANGVLVHRTIGSDGRYCNVRWSPDGSALAFAHFDRTRPAAIERVARTGGTPFAIAPAFDSPEAGQVRWSPDGQTIAYVTSEGGFGDALLMKVDATGATPPVELARINAASSAGHPAWSPDGSSILYVYYETALAALATVPAAGGSSTPLGLTGAGIDGTYPGWLPASIIR